jgi:hypothetical protein
MAALSEPFNCPFMTSAFTPRSLSFHLRGLQMEPRRPVWRRKDLEETRMKTILVTLAAVGALAVATSASAHPHHWHHHWHPWHHHHHHHWH